ncbi:MAG: DUF4178 domain-containing protein [Lacunisphaera sp.]
MSFLGSSNPTKLRVGATGHLQGRAYTVLGRVVLTTADGYKWQEYRLGANNGEEATLVYESGDWKLFRLFEPATPLPAREAALIRADDMITFDGRPVTVTYVGKSKVVYIEGVAPEGVELGDRATYFNADRSGGGMVVVSWTGEEVECYEGHTLREREVAQAFGLPRARWWVRLGTAFRRLEWDAGQVIVIAIVLFFVGFKVVDLLDSREVSFPAPPPKQAAPAVRLPDKAVGHLGSHDYTVTGHALLEVARPGKKFSRHEYALTDENGKPALLVQSPDGNPAEWQVLTPAAFPETFTPFDAARVTVGKVTLAEGKTGEATVFLLNLERADGVALAWPPPTQYGFMVRLSGHCIHARWTEKILHVYIGQGIPARDVAAAFHSPALLAN